MTGWLVPWDDLSLAQRRAVELPVRDHQIVVGAPGSGKTLVLVHRAKRLWEDLRVSDDRFRVFVYTNALKNYIREGLSDLRLPEENVLTFDQWCCRFHEQHIRGSLPRGPDRKRDFQAIRVAVLQRLNAAPLQPQYDFVLVDEGQDLNPVCFQILRLISRHVTVCFDQKQSIFEAGSTEAEIRQKLGIRSAVFSVLEAYRCCPYIVQLAAQFLDDAQERNAFLNQSRTAQTRKEMPVWFRAPSFEDERKNLIEMVRLRQGFGERTAILLPKNRQIHGFAAGMREAGLEVETPSRNQEEGYDFSSPLPKVMSYHSAKGLTFDSVLLPRLTVDSFERYSADHLLRLLFVGVTRATGWVYLSSTTGNACAPLGRLLSPESRYFLAIQQGSVQAAPAAQAEHEEEGDLTDFL
ncbi:MAG: UvrD-helicase domain-containing protein [Planctomycetota bacterium]